MYFLLLVLCWCAASSWRIIWRHTFHHGWQKSPKKQALHLTRWVLCIDHTMHRNFSVDIFFLESLVRVFWTKFITRELTFSFLLGHGNLKWLNTEAISPGSDAYKWELNWTLWLVSWFKTRTPTGCGTTNTTDTKKAHVQPVAGTFDAHTHAWDRK